jgi:hypothetical protein
LETHPAGLFNQAQFVMKDVVHGAQERDPMGSDNIHAGHTNISFTIGVTAAMMPKVCFVFQIETMQTISAFSGVNFFDDVVKAIFIKDLSPKASSVMVFFSL